MCQFIPNTRILNSKPFRVQHLWVEDTERVIRESMVFLKEVFDEFAETQHYPVPGHDTVIILIEFRALLRGLKLFSDVFTPREAVYVFLLSRSHQVAPESAPAAAYGGGLTFEEFLEAIARVATCISGDCDMYPHHVHKLGTPDIAKTGVGSASQLPHQLHELVEMATHWMLNKE